MPTRVPAERRSSISSRNCRTIARADSLILGCAVHNNVVREADSVDVTNGYGVAQGVEIMSVPGRGANRSQECVVEVFRLLPSSTVQKQRWHLGSAVALNALGFVRWEVLSSHLQIVMRLQIQPELRRVAKVQGEPQCRVGGNATAIVDDLSDPIRRDPDRLGQLIL